MNVNELLSSHVQLELECVDRLYLNGYVPNLQVGGQVVRFLCDHLGNPIPSRAILERIGNRFRDAVQQFAARRRVPLVRFAKGERKVERMKPLFAKVNGENGNDSLNGGPNTDNCNGGPAPTQPPRANSSPASPDLPRSIGGLIALAAARSRVRAVG